MDKIQKNLQVCGRMEMMMKKKYIGILAGIIAVIVFAVVLSDIIVGDTSKTVYKQGERPYDYGYAKWVSEDPDMWFVTYGEKEEDKYWDIPEGVIRMDEQLIPFEARFDEETDVVFVLDDGDDDYLEGIKEKEEELTKLICGKCTFFPDELQVQVSETGGLFFHGKKLIFKRIALQAAVFDYDEETE